jgi:ankyrin repeat protein
LKDLELEYNIGWATHKANTTSTLFLNRNALHKAAKKGHVEFIRMLVKDYNVNVDPLTSTHQTPLHDACQYNQIHVVQYLCASGANPSIRDSIESQGYNAAFEACRFRNLDIVMFLVEEEKTLLNCVDNYGHTMLHFACINNPRNEDMIRYLVHAGADIYVKDDFGRTPYDVYRVFGGTDESIVKILIKRVS